MPLNQLACFRSKISSLAPLRGLPLKMLNCGGNPIDDLSPLSGMPLGRAHFDATEVSDLTPLKNCTTLRSLTLDDTKVTVEAIESLRKALPECKILCKNPLPSAADGH